MAVQARRSAGIAARMPSIVNGIAGVVLSTSNTSVVSLPNAGVWPLVSVVLVFADSRLLLCGSLTIRYPPATPGLSTCPVTAASSVRIHRFDTQIELIVSSDQPVIARPTTAAAGAGADIEDLPS